MSDKDLASIVSAFMINSAPTLVVADAISLGLVKAVARQLLYKVRTSREHAGFVISKKYSHLYTRGAIEVIIDEAIADEVSERVEISRKNRANKRAAKACAPSLLIA